MAEKHVHKVYGSFPPWGKSVEFPASGGGGNYVYFDTSSITEFGDEADSLYNNAYLIKEQISNGDIIVTLSSWSYSDTPPLAVCIDMNLKMTAWDESGENPLPEMTTLGEDIAKYAPWILDLPRLTEKEFYKVAPDPWAGPTLNVTRYNGEIVTINYEEGMTWYEWCNSKHNTIGLSAYIQEGYPEYNYVHYGNGSPELLSIASGGGLVLSQDVISSNLDYITQYLD
jgi:hypothetical protein